MKSLLKSLLVLALYSPISALAMFHCEGSLTKDDFGAERAQIQKELQANILKYRKLEGSTMDASGSNKAEMDATMAEIQKQKEKFQQLDSKYFPRTPVTAYGSACSDRRWLEEAKSKLVQNPEHLGKHWHVWLDKTTRKAQAALEKPSYEKMAE